eukprot:scaffold44616_cov65-Phaeocystis_antarctica.AAC.1
MGITRSPASSTVAQAVTVGSHRTTSAVAPPRAPTSTSFSTLAASGTWQHCKSATATAGGQPTGRRHFLGRWPTRQMGTRRSRVSHSLRPATAMTTRSPSTGEGATFVSTSLLGAATRRGSTKSRSSGPLITRFEPFAP